MKVKIYALIVFATIFTVITTANAQNSEGRSGDRYSGNTYLAMMGSGGMMGGYGMGYGMGYGPGACWN